MNMKLLGEIRARLDHAHLQAPTGTYRHLQAPLKKTRQAAPIWRGALLSWVDRMNL